MGYCHYWKSPSVLPLFEFSHFSEDVRRLVSSVKPRWFLFGGIRITGGDGAGAPLISEEQIRFNGRPRFETFWIARDFRVQNPTRAPSEDGVFEDFVKTQRLPYDTVVTAALIALKHHFPEVEIASDGGRDEWAKGISLYSEVLGRPIPEKGFPESFYDPS
jgi:hypothetical protein